MLYIFSSFWIKILQNLVWKTSTQQPNTQSFCALYPPYDSLQNISSLWLIWHCPDPKPRSFQLICETITHFWSQNCPRSPLIFLHLHWIRANQMHSLPSGWFCLIQPLFLFTLMNLQKIINKFVIIIKSSHNHHIHSAEQASLHPCFPIGQTIFFLFSYALLQLEAYN